MPLLLKGFTHHTINTGEVEIGYSVGPDNGPPMLLLHGVTSRRDTFLNMLDSIVPDHCVITMDQRGHGYSGHVPGKYGKEDHARDIKFVIENVCKEAPIVWGHSMGGGNTVETAGRDPQLCRALILEDPAIFSGSRAAPRSDSPTHRLFRIYLDLIEAGLPAAEMEAKIREANPHEPDFFPAWKTECLMQMDVEILRNVVEGKSRGGGDPVKYLANIQCPVLLAQADPLAGGILPDDYLESVVPKRKNFTVKKIAGAGHNINREYPDLFLRVLLPWLKGLK